MQRWVGKVALVTGASAGIGEAITEALVKNGVKVIGVARRVKKVEELKEKLSGEEGELYPVKCDVAKIEEIDSTFKWITEHFGTIHVLINNAGIGRPGMITDGKLSHFQDVINTNLVGLTACTQKALQLMKSSGVDDGHIININSVAGHKIPAMPVPLLNVYGATKHGVTALTETLRQELNFQKSKIRVTSISPGVVATEIGQASAAHADTPGEMPEDLKRFYESLPSLESKDIADSVIYVLSTPPHVGIHELIIKPVGEPF